MLDYVFIHPVPLDVPCDLLLAVVTGTKYLTRSLCVGHGDPLNHFTTAQSAPRPSSRQSLH